ncbi:hypothetical protein Tco_0470709 [Tanacetum coccineum]
MLSASELPLSFWAKAVTTACYTQNRSIIISTHGKTAYHIINDRKPSIKHLHIFGCICYTTRDGEILDKMKEKGGSKCPWPRSSRTKRPSDYETISEPRCPQDKIVCSYSKKDRFGHNRVRIIFSPLLEEYYNPAYGHDEENNNDQALNASFQEA